MIRAALSFFAMSGFLGFAALAQEVTGMKLEDSGFKMWEANTHGKMTKLKTFPVRKFARRTRGGVAYFVYADPDFCKCAYVGSEQAMNTFLGMNAASNGLPGYRGPADVSKPSGPNVDMSMVEDMGEDGNETADEDSPALLTIPLAPRTQ